MVLGDCQRTFERSLGLRLRPENMSEKDTDTSVVSLVQQLKAGKMSKDELFARLSKWGAPVFVDLQDSFDHPNPPSLQEQRLHTLSSFFEHRDLTSRFSGCRIQKAKKAQGTGPEAAAPGNDEPTRSVEAEGITKYKYVYLCIYSCLLPRICMPGETCRHTSQQFYAI